MPIRGPVGLETVPPEWDTQGRAAGSRSWPGIAPAGSSDVSSAWRKRVCCVQNDANEVVANLPVLYENIIKYSYALFFKLSHNKSSRLRTGMEYWASILTLTFGTTAVLVCRTLPQGNYLVSIFVRG